VLDVWKAATPHLDVIGPDIYTDSYASYVRTLEQYSRPDNALMVPETGNPAPNARMFFEVVGRRSIGFAPFGIDFTGYSNFPLGALKEDPETLKPFAMNYELVGPFDRLLAKLSYEGKVWGGAEPQDVHEQTIKLGRWQVTASYGRPQFGNPPAKGNPTPSGGFLVAELAPDEYLVTGYHVRLNFGAAQPEMGPSMMAVVEEGHFQDGKWVFDRLWNGDLTDWGLNFTSAPQVLKVKMATY
jgi:beta-galactosidase GanA